MKTPKSWDDITMGNLANYLRLVESKPDGSDIELLYKKIAALIGTTVEEVKNIPIEKLNRISAFAAKLPTRLMISFKLKGQRYRSVIDARKLNGDKYSAIKLAQSRDKYETLPQILFIISEPRKFGIRKRFPFIGWKTIEFQPEDIEARINDFKQLPVSIGWPMASFFLRVCEELKVRLKEFSLSELDKMTEQMNSLRTDLESDTDL